MFLLTLTPEIFSGKFYLKNRKIYPGYPGYIFKGTGAWIESIHNNLKLKQYMIVEAKLRITAQNVPRSIRMEAICCCWKNLCNLHQKQSNHSTYSFFFDLLFLSSSLLNKVSGFMINCEYFESTWEITDLIIVEGYRLCQRSYL